MTERQLVLVLVGDGEERQALELRAKDAGIDARFLGFLEGDDLVDAYAAADAAVLLSRRETWGVVVNEAMASGLPIIATERVGATADLVKEGENGFVVASGDAERAASSLAYLADNPEVQARFGKRSRAPDSTVGLQRRGEEPRRGAPGLSASALTLFRQARIEIEAGDATKRGEQHRSGISSRPKIDSAFAFCVFTSTTLNFAVNPRNVSLETKSVWGAAIRRSIDRRAFARESACSSTARPARERVRLASSRVGSLNARCRPSRSPGLRPSERDGPRRGLSADHRCGAVIQLRPPGRSSQARTARERRALNGLGLGLPESPERQLGVIETGPGAMSRPV